MNQRQIIYICLWLLASFIAVIAATQLFATIFNSNAGQMVGQSIAFLTLLVTGIVAILNQTGTKSGNDTTDLTTDETADADITDDSPGPDVEPATQAYSFRDTDDTGRQSSLHRSNTDILDDAEARLEDHITIYDTGTIELNNYDDLNLYSQFMLYIIAKRLAAEAQFVDTPQVTGDELLNRFGYTKVDLMLFLDEAGDRLTPMYSMGYRTGNIDYATIKDIEITVDIQRLTEITDWTLDEQQTTRWNLRSKINHALTELGEARDAYDNADDPHQPQTQREIGRYVKNACGAVQQYPVEIGYGGNWKTFSRYAEALLDFLDDDLAEKVDHCVPRMKRALRNMDEQVAGETLLERNLSQFDWSEESSE